MRWWGMERSRTIETAAAPGSGIVARKVELPVTASGDVEPTQRVPRCG